MKMLINTLELKSILIHPLPKFCHSKKTIATYHLSDDSIYLVSHSWYYKNAIASHITSPESI